MPVNAAADMGEVGHAGRVGTLPDRAGSQPDLHRDPSANDDDRRQHGDEVEQEHAHLVTREPDDVGAHDSGDGTGGPQVRDLRLGIDRDLGE